MRGMLKRAYSSKQQIKEEKDKPSPSTSRIKRLGQGGLGAAGIFAGTHYGAARQASKPIMNDVLFNPDTYEGVSVDDLKEQIGPEAQVSELPIPYMASQDDIMGRLVDNFDVPLMSLDDGHEVGKPTVYAPEGTKDIGAMAHEFGHLEGADNTLTRQLHRMGGVSAGPYGMGAGALIGGGMATSENEKMRKWAPAGAVAPMVPGLIEEARANIHGDRILRDAGLSGDDLTDARKTLGKSYLSYLGAGAGLGAGAYGLSKLTEKLRGGNKDERQNARESDSGEKPGISDVADER